jgi:hypothetical protein
MITKGRVAANVAQRAIRTAANLTSTLLAHHIAVKLEMILDRETKLSHETFAAQIEGRLGAGDKGPDQKVWSKGKGLNNVGVWAFILDFAHFIIAGGLAVC